MSSRGRLGYAFFPDILSFSRSVDSTLTHDGEKDLKGPQDFSGSAPSSARMDDIGEDEGEEEDEEDGPPRSKRRVEKPKDAQGGGDYHPTHRNLSQGSAHPSSSSLPVSSDRLSHTAPISTSTSTLSKRPSRSSASDPSLKPHSRSPSDDSSLPTPASGYPYGSQGGGGYRRQHSFGSGGGGHGGGGGGYPPFYGGGGTPNPSSNFPLPPDFRGPGRGFGYGGGGGMMRQGSGQGGGPGDDLFSFMHPPGSSNEGRGSGGGGGGGGGFGLDWPVHGPGANLGGGGGGLGGPGGVGGGGGSGGSGGGGTSSSQSVEVRESVLDDLAAVFGLPPASSSVHPSSSVHSSSAVGPGSAPPLGNVSSSTTSVSGHHSTTSASTSAYSNPSTSPSTTFANLSTNSPTASSPTRLVPPLRPRRTPTLLRPRRRRRRLRTAHPDRPPMGRLRRPLRPRSTVLAPPRRMDTDIRLDPRLRMARPGLPSHHPGQGGGGAGAPGGGGDWFDFLTPNSGPNANGNGGVRESVSWERGGGVDAFALGRNGGGMGGGRSGSMSSVGSMNGASLGREGMNGGGGASIWGLGVASPKASFVSDVCLAITRGMRARSRCVNVGRFTPNRSTASLSPLPSVRSLEISGLFGLPFPRLGSLHIGSPRVGGPWLGQLWSHVPQFGTPIIGRVPLTVGQILLVDSPGLVSGIDTSIDLSFALRKSLHLPPVGSSALSELIFGLAILAQEPCTTGLDFPSSTSLATVREASLRSMTSRRFSPCAQPRLPSLPVTCEGDESACGTAAQSSGQLNECKIVCAPRTRNASSRRALNEGSKVQGGRRFRGSENNPATLSACIDNSGPINSGISQSETPITVVVLELHFKRLDDQFFNCIAAPIFLQPVDPHAVAQGHEECTDGWAFAVLNAHRSPKLTHTPFPEFLEVQNDQTVDLGMFLWLRHMCRYRFVPISGMTPETRDKGNVRQYMYRVCRSGSWRKGREREW
ncbi:hypothetical protein FA13DRAFT_1720691 [Coprinellus micaceus]|uniref:Uncharacterized protein n=1 Tax=Coprinellus micaceus TaxID=71717 RepID=A0A4Y7S6U0_COPMI|nr:hypothetical protein FA13DRAFT_1720691 [Coprinellus micaceus]